VLCRLRYRLEQFAPRDPTFAADAAAAPGQPPGSEVLALEDRGADGGGRAGG